jgi:iron transport multicopper oxidase
MFWFWVDGHHMRLIEADGVDVQETPVNIQSLSVAQRYSFLITARNDTGANWAIHANMDPTMFDSVPHNLQLNITSVISYGSQGDVQPSSLIKGDYTNTVDDSKLVPLQAQPIGAPSQSIPLTALFNTYDNGVNRASFENITWNTPRTPTYLSAATSGQTDPAWYGPSASVLKLDEVVELLVVNGDTGAHPFHLHGHKFAIAWKSFNITSEDPSINPPVPDVTPNPMWRDTVMIPPGGGARLRFVADNPGTWLFHCHIDWHFSAGLAWVLVESPESIFSTQLLQPSQTLSSQCAALGYPASGNAAGHNDSAADYRGWQLGPYLQKHPKGIGAT